MLQIDISNLEYQNLLDFASSHISDFGNFDLEVIFKADYNQSKIIRDFILFLFERNKINVPWKNRFVLVSDELVNNSIEYGSLPLDKNSFTIHFKTEQWFLNVNIETQDTGKWFESKTSKEMEEIRQIKESEWFTGYLWKRGRWLFQLVTHVVDELYFRDSPDGWLVVGIRKKLELM